MRVPCPVSRVPWPVLRWSVEVYTPVTSHGPRAPASLQPPACRSRADPCPVTRAPSSVPRGPFFLQPPASRLPPAVLAQMRAPSPERPATASLRRSPEPRVTGHEPRGSSRHASRAKPVLSEVEGTLHARKCAKPHFLLAFPPNPLPPSAGRPVLLYLYRSKT